MSTQTFGGRLRGGKMMRPAFTPEMQASESFRRELAQWFYVAFESRHQIPEENASEEAIRYRGLLSSLIAWGEWAQVQTIEKQIDLSPIGVTLEDVQAETRILRDTFRSIFDNCLSEKEAESILNEVFG